MSVSTGQAKLKEAGKELAARWAEARGYWHDDVARRFETEFVEPLLAALRDAQEAMSRMDAVVEQVRRDCADAPD